tara:strand:+ start:150 stop:734 length:585 start_codon:yes stop_codon:yes gene_type:complete
MTVLAGCTKEPLINDLIVETAIRDQLKKPEGELTTTDLLEVRLLHLHNTQITDAGLKEIAKLTQLIELDLLGCNQLTDKGLKELSSLQHLETLGLPGQITDEGLKLVTEFNQITTLGLKDCSQISDLGLRELTKLNNLSSLWLPPQITDASLKEIIKLKQLELLVLSGSKITATGIAEAIKALPKCNILSKPIE